MRIFVDRGDLRPVRVVHGVPAPRPLHDAGARADRRHPHRGVPRARVTSGTCDSASRCSPACTSSSTSIPAIRAPDRPRRARGAHRGGDACVGRRPPRDAHRRRAARRTALDLAAPLGRRVPGRVPRRLRRGRGARRPRVLREHSTRRGGLAVRLGAERRPRAPTSSCTASARQPSLSDVLPSLTNMGVVVEDERPYDITPRELDTALDQALPAARPEHADRHRRGRRPVRGGVPRGARAAPPKTTASTGSCSCAGLSLARGRRCSARTAGTSRQIGTLYSQAYIEDALAAHPDIARGLVELFVTRLDPWLERPGGHRPPRRPARGRARRGRRRSTRTASCAACCTSCSRRCARTGSRPVRERRAARGRRAQARPGAHPRRAASRGRCSRSSCTRRASKACTCARGASRAAASAGRTGARTSAPRSSA